MSVTGPVKPSVRSVSAALRPASEAPTITMRPLSLKAALAPLLLMRFPCVLQYSRGSLPVATRPESPAPDMLRRRAAHAHAALRRGRDRTRALPRHAA